jgi:SnoaL-like domain
MRHAFNDELHSAFKDVNDLLLRVRMWRHSTAGGKCSDHLIHRLTVCDRPAGDSRTNFNRRILSFHGATIGRAVIASSDFCLPDRYGHEEDCLRISIVRTRSTIEVLEDHLERRKRGDIDGDLEHKYAQDIILLCEKSVLKGRDAVRTSAKALADQLPGARFRFPFKAVDGDHALLHWSAQSANARVDLGADTFAIRDGRIVLQTVSYRLKNGDSDA